VAVLCIEKIQIAQINSWFGQLFIFLETYAGGG